MNGPPRLKTLERTWKKIWLRLLRAFVRRISGPRDAPDWRRDPVRVLFLRHDRIGDAIVSTGIFRAIAEAAPNVKLSVLASPRNRGVLESDAHLDRVHVFDRKRILSYPAIIRELRSARYDAVIDCMVTAPSMTTLLLMVASGARHRIGVEGRGIDDVLTVRVPPNREARHIIEHLAALAAPFGASIETTDWRPRLPVEPDDAVRAEAAWPPEANGPVFRALINVSAGRPTRNWPTERFVSAIEHIRQRRPNSEFVTIGAPSEWARVQQVAALAGISAVPTPRLADAVSLVDSADFVLTPDTSIAHVASATGTPAVVMYLRGTSKLWGLYQTAGVSLESPSLSLEDLPLDTVLDAIDQVLKAAVVSR